MYIHKYICILCMYICIHICKIMEALHLKLFVEAVDEKRLSSKKPPIDVDNDNSNNDRPEVRPVHSPEIPPDGNAEIHAGPITTVPERWLEIHWTLIKYGIYNVVNDKTDQFIRTTFVSAGVGVRVRKQMCS
jgi:hypothetical protein